MKKLFIVLLIMTATSLLTFARPIKRIYFKKGATKTTVTGYLNGYKDKQTYLIRVRAGQVLRAETNGLTVGIESPTGEYFFNSDLSCHSGAETTADFSDRQNGRNSLINSHANLKAWQKVNN